MTILKSLTIGALLLTGTALFAARQAPKLILQITVDQLRGDLPDRYMKNMGEGGFRYLKAKGVWYKNASYGYSNTETVVGHTTLATGADPAVHGMVSNVWYDRDTDKLAYNIEDKRYHLLTENADVNKSSEVDTSQALASTDGRSPANIMVSTFSDELRLFTNGKSKVFAVSVKDRGAVTLAGHAGKAFWFSKATGTFITSSYYYDDYPDWVKAYNDKKPTSIFENKAWTLLLDKSKYMFGEDDNQSWETDVMGFGRTFPHDYGSAKDKTFTSYLTFSPAGDSLTLDFAKATIEAEELGQREATDYLAVSFSSTDYVGHIFGPSSLEAEDNLLRLDRTLSDLFHFVDQKVGLENTLIVLSADHGAPEAPGYLKKFGIEAHGVFPREWDKAPSITRLKKKFGIGEQLIESFFPPYLYLNREAIKAKGLDMAEVEQAVANEIMSIKGVALAVSAEALKKNELPDTFLNNAARKNFNPKRSGDILVLFQPHCFINGIDGVDVASNHGGAWRYDTYVPIIFLGWRLNGKQIFRKVRPNDIAPTLAKIVGAKPPSGTNGDILVDIIKSVE